MRYILLISGFNTHQKPISQSLQYNVHKVTRIHLLKFFHTKNLKVPPRKISGYAAAYSESCEESDKPHILVKYW